MRDLIVKKNKDQPNKVKTCGSTFKNPDREITVDLQAWELIDQAGCRGLVRGGAQVSEIHCNFLINNGNASAADLEELGEEVRRRVYAHSGIMLQWEICIIGEHGLGPELAEESS